MLSFNDNVERIDDLGVNNLKVIQNKQYFCFGTDSVLLANFVESNNPKNNIIDFCSGSGVIPILLYAKCKYNKIYAIELQAEMFDLLKRNIALNNIDNIHSINCDIKDLSKIKEELNINLVDIIVCNPPYKKMGTGVSNDNSVKYIARHEEKCSIEDVFKSASNLLRSRGKLYIVHKPDRLVDLITIANKYRLEAKRMQFVYPRIGSKPSIVLIEYVKDGGSELNILKPLIEYDEIGNYTKDILKIYGMDNEDK